MPQEQMSITVHCGWVRDMRYLPEFCRYEALVVLSVSGGPNGAAEVELVTSVEAHPDEAPRALRERLVYDAARLFRVFETGLDRATPIRQAA